MSYGALYNYDVMQVGGTAREVTPTMLDHYAFRYLGPIDIEDAVIFSKRIAPTVIPTAESRSKTLKKGTIFSLSPQGDMVPGISAEAEYPVAAILVGSDADDGDVTGGVYTGSPLTHEGAYPPFKYEANAPFWSLNCGVVFQTDAFIGDAALLLPGTPLTVKDSSETVTPTDGSPNYTAYDFDEAGKLQKGAVYQDHIVGVIIEGPAPTLGYKKSLFTIKFQGNTLPKLTKAALDAIDVA
jgi:hypothetical protein